MARWSKRLFCIAFSFMFSFLAIGYAQLTNPMYVTGLANVKEPEMLYIKSIEVVSEGGSMTAEGEEIMLPTNIQNKMYVGRYRSSNRVIYKITVKNNTRYKYVYQGIKYDATAADNSYLQNGYLKIATRDTQNGSDGSFNTSDTVDPWSERTFYAVYSTTSRLTYKEFSAFVNYQFGIHVDSLGAMAAERIIRKFGEILNTESTYQDLITHIDDKYVNQGWQSNYIGNVVGAYSNDTIVIERLFGDELYLTIEGTEVSVTVMIKRTDVDDNPNTGDNFTAVNGNNSYTGNGCEMTLYITTNDLDKKIESGEYAGASDWADVYVAVFTCDKNSDGTYSDWYHVGGIYDGIAPMVSYDGSTNGTGSFITDDWTPLQKTYKVTERYSYTINTSDGRNDNVEDIREIMAIVDQAAITEYRTLLAEADEAIAYINANSDYFADPVFTEHIERLHAITAEAKAMNVTNQTKRVWLIQILQKLENAVYPFYYYIK